MASIIVSRSKTPLNETDIIYMIMTDRFYDGNYENNGKSGEEYRPGDLNFRQGGDWKGLMEKIPFLRNMGITALWISPPQKNQILNKAGTQAGYHGYNTYDFLATDPHFGTKDELQELINTLHNAGIKIILDAVPNHTADYLAPNAVEYISKGEEPAAPFNNPTWYHHEGDITNYEDPYQIVNHDLGGLDDLDHDNPQVVLEICRVYDMWLDMGFDGIRIDACSQLPKWFIKQFQDHAELPCFGEVFNGSVEFVSDYQNYQWGVLDFPLFFAARSAFAEGPDIDFSGVKAVFDQDYKYANSSRLVTFIDNHDRDRFLAWADDDYKKLMNALTFIMVSRGLPDIYYGTDQAMTNLDGIVAESGILERYNLREDGSQGAADGSISDQYNRACMESFDERNPIYQHIQRLVSIRKTYPSLSWGIQREVYYEPHFYGFSRIQKDPEDEVISLFNNSWEVLTRDVPILKESSLAIGTKLTNLLDTSYQSIIKEGGITGRMAVITVPAQSAVVLTSRQSAEGYNPVQLNETLIRVHYKSGYGNFLSIRGNCFPLWWNKGRSMRNMEMDTWEFSIYRLKEGEALEFKILLNDKSYSLGNNYVIEGGQSMDIYPSF